MMDLNVVIYLLDRARKGVLTKEEYVSLQQWLENPKNKELYDRLNDEQIQENKVEQLMRYDFNSGLRKVRKTIKRTSLRRSKVKKLAFLGVAAACVIAIFALSINITNKELPVNDQWISPGKDIATLTLEDGTEVPLTSDESRELLKRKGMRLDFDSTGMPILEAGQSMGDRGGWHTVQTPNAGQYAVRLPDKSLVYLNAASSISYPLDFLSNRRVNLKGEAYFDIEKLMSDKGSVPFEVHMDDHFVQVLGTAFNINSYAEYDRVETTVTEGQVRIVGKGFDTVLSSGQQAQVWQDGGISIRLIDTKLFADWKDGYFYFDDMTIEQIMNKVAKWYNIEVVYAGEITNEKFGGEISRSSNLDDLIDILEMTNKVQFKIEGRRVTVMP